MEDELFGSFVGLTYANGALCPVKGDAPAAGDPTFGIQNDIGPLDIFALEKE